MSSELAGRLMPIAVLAGWFGFAAVFFFRRRPSQAAPVVGRDPRSTIGIAVQACAFAMVWTLRRPAITPIWPGVPVLDWCVLVLVVASMGGAVATVMLAVHELGRQWSPQARIVEHHELITSGPYRFVRHPIYAGMGVMLFATGLTLTRWWALAVALVVFGVGTAFRASVEDALLAGACGAAFSAFRDRVPAVFPRWRRR